jgi:hypothetical protein
VMPELFQSCYRTMIAAGPGRRAAAASGSPCWRNRSVRQCVIVCVEAEPVVPAAARSAKGFRERKDMDFRVFSWKMALEIGVAMRPACVPAKPVLGLEDGHRFADTAMRQQEMGVA